MRLPAILSWACLVLGAEHLQAQTPDHAVVLGFDRIHGSGKTSSADGGRLLLGELGCVSCHKADAAVEKSILKRQAPILDGVGGRVRTAYLREFLSNPSATKPGTTMPHVLHGLPEGERKEAVEALVHFLASTGSVKDARPLPKSIAVGQKLYHQVGCVACHGPRNTQLKGTAAINPLGDLTKKHSIVGLAAFLLDPHKIRPSGRMPGLHLTSQEAQDIAHYLLADLQVAGGAVTLEYSYYELSGQPDKLPDFKMLKPRATGKSAGFDVGNALRVPNVAMKFDGFLKIDTEGFYNFHVNSDDGSKLWIKDQLVVNNDGIHPPTTKSGGMRLPKGSHPLTLGVFNAGGGFELDAEIEGPGVPRQPLANWVFASDKVEPKKSEKEKPNGAVVVDAEMAKKGQALFAGLGCASCHTMQQGKAAIASTLKAPPLTGLKSDAGCLADQPATKAPRFHLNAAQRTALAAALKDLPAIASKSAKDAIAHSMAALNCYACHQRDGKGGVEAALNDSFQTPQKEMGDEGRIPPTLDGVGAKLNPTYMKKVLGQGATDRPYMLTRMPKFGDANAGHLQAAFETADPVTPVPVPKFTANEKKVKSEGRFMVGGKAFGCIKCHNFREFKGGGVQGINMVILTDRVRREWFVRYLLDPNKIRPGTRMPSVWPLGQSQLPKVLDGDTMQQIEAIWLYLADGTKAANPYGVGKEPIPLIATTEPVLYRNFIQGAGPRAIGVGYPEKVNLAFDANELRMALLWHHEFIDAARHWTDRGVGFEGPLGEGVVTLGKGPDVAVLEKTDAPWPAKIDKERDHFKGYRLDDKMRPAFLYEIGESRVEDAMIPVEGKDGAHFKRVLTVSSPLDKDGMVKPHTFLRAAAGASIKDLGKGWYAVGNELKIRVESTAPPIVRTSGKQQELLVPIRDRDTKVVVEMMW